MMRDLDQQTDAGENWQLAASYSRAEALRHGVLADVSDTAREAGFSCPVAVTSAVWLDVVVPTELDRAHGQSAEGRLWDILWVLRHRACRTSASEVLFDVLVIRGGQQVTVPLRAVIEPGDTGEPVITVMLTAED